MRSTATVSEEAVFSPKPHYMALDALRGIAALLVVFYHIFEGFSFSGGLATIEVINHGYLAVDFFFILSGFVVGYAYDDRWGKGMSLWQFFRRRLIRLHPMVCMGAVIGLLTFMLQGGVTWAGYSVGTGAALLALLCAFLMIPAYPGAPYEVRGNGEMFPLNGPSWSLFFEYIGNILYAMVLRRLSKGLLLSVTLVLGVLLLAFTSLDMAGIGMFGVGWTLDGINFFGGLLRMTFPFSCGLLLSKLYRPRLVRGGFLLAASILVMLLFVPYIGIKASVSLNGLYEAFCILLAFPAVVWLGASDDSRAVAWEKAYRWLGDLSYPLYATHYPIMYLFYAWLIEHHYSHLGQCPWMALSVYVICVSVGWLCLRFYDLPVRKWLGGRWNSR